MTGRHTRTARALRTGLSTAVAAALMVAPVAAVAQAADPASAASPESSPGRPLTGPEVAVPHHEGGTFDFDDGWRFALVSTTGVTDPTGAYEQAATPGYDDSRWRAIHVPHDWSIEQNPSAGPATTSGTGFYPGGLGWYRKTFTLPRSMAGRHLAVEFDGVYMDSEVYLNGRLLGRHHYGYTGFSLDLTGAHTDGRTPNVLAVEVRNQVPSSRWYSGSGIYRNVRLVVTNPVHVQRLGVVVTTPGLDQTSGQGYATARVATTVDATSDATGVQVSSTVRDQRGRVVGSAGTTVTTGDAPVTGTVDVRVPHPHLWDVDDPYRYSVTTELRVGGRVVDSYVTRTGFRWTKFDPQSGFWLNGRRVKLQGIDLHHDLGALGAAVNYDARLRQLQIMKSMGVNALRTSHNPPDPETVQICEQLGIVMMVEAFDVWNVAKVPYDYARFFDTDSDADIAEMVEESRNSPAVVMWSIGNEIPNSWQPEAVPIARRLIDDVRALDPTRPVTIGSDKYRSVPEPGSPLEQELLMLDGVGLNYNSAGSVDALHQRYPDTLLFMSESSSETSTRGEYDQPEQLNTGENHTPGRRAASSYDNNLKSWTISGEYSLKMDRDRPWFLGQFLWTGTDYIGEPTPFDAYPVKTSFFGAVDTAGFAKDQYYLFQSQWTRRPMVHLLPTDWSDHQPGEPVQVWAYSNADSVELLLNGRSLGVRRFDRKVAADGRTYLETTGTTGDDKNVDDPRFPKSYLGADGTAGHLRLTWSVPYQPGRLVAVARQGDRVVARDEVRSAGAADAIHLSVDHRVRTADGRSLAFVTADVVDQNGVLVPSADPLVRFAVHGGRLVGVDNGREESAESYEAPYRTAFHGKALAIVSPDQAGVVRITATARGLRAGATRVVAKPAGPADTASQGAAPVTWFTPGAPTTPVPAAQTDAGGFRTDASFSGTEQTGPQEMVDGDPATGWSNLYVQDATALLPQISAARPADWVSLAWTPTRSISAVTAAFTVDAQRSLPATVKVEFWTGRSWQAVSGARVAWATDSGGPTTISFDAVSTSRLRLSMTSRYPQSSNGFVGISELTVS